MSCMVCDETAWPRTKKRGLPLLLSFFTWSLSTRIEGPSAVVYVIYIHSSSLSFLTRRQFYRVIRIAHAGKRSLGSQLPGGPEYEMTS